MNYETQISAFCDRIVWLTELDAVGAMPGRCTGIAPMTSQPRNFAAANQ